MPKKNRAKFKSPVSKRQHNSSGPSRAKGDGVIIRNPFTSEGEDITVTLKCLKEMFDGKVDGEAIFTIFSACDYNVNETIEALISVSNEGSSSLSHRELQKAPVSFAGSAYSHTEFKNEYKSSETEFSQLASQQFEHSKPTIVNHETCDNYSDLEQICSSSLKGSFVRQASNVASPSDCPGRLNNGHEMVQKQYENSEEPLTVSNNLFDKNIKYSVNSDNPCSAEKVDTAIIINSDLYHVESFSCNYNVPSFGPAERNSIDNRVESESKIYFPHLLHQAESDRNSASFFYSQYQSPAAYGYKDSPPQFITPLIPPYKGRSNFNSYTPFKNKDVAISVPSNKKSSSPKSSAEPYSSHQNMIKEVIDKIIINCKVLIILRGLPGSGKSSLATKLQHSGVIFSTDDFFYKRGKYCFRWAKLPEAHEWNRKRTARAMERALTPIIIDNTNVERWEIKPYVILGLQFKYDIHILEPDTPWKFKPGELSKRNRHNVTKDKIERMLERYEHNVTVESVVESLQNAGTGNSSGLEEITIYDAVPNDEYSALDYKINIASKMQEEVYCPVGGVENIPEKEFMRKQSGSLSSLDENSNSVLLEAVVHREDETLTCQSENNDSVEHSGSSCDISVNELFSNSSEMAASSGDAEGESDNGQNGSIEDIDELQNFICLKDLMILNEQGNEECQTSSNQLSPSCSSHDSSNWEVITNQEDDFTWTSNLRNTREPDVTYSEQGNTNQPAFEIPKEDLISESPVCENHIKDEIIEKISVASGVCALSPNVTVESVSGMKTVPLKQLSTSEWGAAESICTTPKLQRELTHMPQKKTFPNGSHYSLFKKNLAHAEWGSIAEEEENSISWDEDLESSKSKSEKSENVVLPKPQRNLISGAGMPSDASFHKILKRGESPQSTLLETVPENEEFAEERVPAGTTLLSSDSARKRKHDNLLSDSRLNLGLDWKFPDFVSEVSGLSITEAPKKCTMSCSETQTEPHDFILLHGSSHTNTYNKNFSVLIPSPYSKQLQNKDLSASEECSDISVPKIATFDKSTFTCDIPDIIGSLEKLHILQDCFPDISFEDLKLHFEAFQGDTEWLTNSLLDWGYKYNVKETAAVENLCELEGNDFLLSKMKEKTGNGVAVPSTENHPDLEIRTDGNSTTVLQDFAVEENEYDNFKGDLVAFNGKCDHISSSNAKQINNGGLTMVNGPSTSTAFASGNAEDLQDSEMLHVSQKLKLKLDPAFALQLEEHFGPVEKGSSSGSSDHVCVVEVDMDLARQIYKRWCETVQKSVANKPDIKGVCDTKRTVAEKKECDLSNIFCNTSNNFGPVVSELAADTGEVSFAEIMDHEYALQISEKERLNFQKSRKSNVAVQLKKQKLYRKFPGIDKRALNDVLEANNFSLKNTIIAMDAYAGRSRCVGEGKVDNDLYDGINTEGSRTTLTDSEDVLQNFIYENWSDWVDPNAYEVESTCLDDFSLSSGSLREEARQHHSFHRQHMKNAQCEYQRGMRQVAAYYRQKSHYHLEKFKELNKEAVQVIMEENRAKTSSHLTLDLHGLFVPEAIHMLEKFMKSRRTEYVNSTDTDPLVVSVITGQGTRSANGPRLKASVVEYFKSKGLRFDQVSGGMFNVTIAQK